MTVLSFCFGIDYQEIRVAESVRQWKAPVQVVLIQELSNTTRHAKRDRQRATPHSVLSPDQLAAHLARHVGHFHLRLQTRKLFPVLVKTLTERLDDRFGGYGAIVRSAWRIQHSQQIHLLAHSVKLLGHLEGNDTSEAPAAQQVWPVRLNGTEFLHVMSCHFFDAGVRQVTPVQPLRLKAVNRTCRCEVTRQTVEEQNGARTAVNTEQWRHRSLSLNSNQRSPTTCSGFVLRH